MKKKLGDIVVYKSYISEDDDNPGLGIIIDIPYGNKTHYSIDFFQTWYGVCGDPETTVNDQYELYTGDWQEIYEEYKEKYGYYPEGIDMNKITETKESAFVVRNATLIGGKKKYHNMTLEIKRSYNGLGFEITANGQEEYVGFYLDKEHLSELLEDLQEVKDAL